MSSLLRLTTLLSWALWFGGLMTLFLSVQVLFHQTERPIFLASAPHLFIAFERYQLFLAAIAVLSAFIRRMISPLPHLTTLCILFSLAAIGAVIEPTLITPKIEALRIQGATHTPEFLRLHGLSMCVYMTVAILLLVAGILQATNQKSFEPQMGHR
jgi:hypothetical protein